MKKTNFLLICLISVLITQCAKRGIPDGGPKDEAPPFLLKAEPKQNSINFSEKRIRLYFNEYIKLKDFRKQLVVSPPIDKALYSISPQSGASKYIQIDINNSLPKNTTYVFNFGQSIVDNNEGNPLPFFKYVFSTGGYIDSLKISGNIKSAIKRTPDDFISTFLYPFDENFNDSLIFNSIPNYVGSTLDSTNYEMTNLKKGKYLLVAIKDVNNNYKFDPAFEQIGFVSDLVDLPINDSLNMEVFKENLPFKSFKPFLESNNRVGFGFSGIYSNVTIELLNNFDKDIKSVLTKNKEKDTLSYWFSDIKYDSLRFVLNNNEQKNYYTVKFKEAEKDSLIITPSTKTSLELDEKFKIFSNIPLDSINTEYIKLINKDSISIPFKAVIDKNNFDIVFDFELLPNDKYTLSVFPNAIADFFKSSNDTLNYSFSTKSRADYGTIKARIENIVNFPIIVQLTNEKEEVIQENILASYDDACVFENILPSKYFIRIIEDANENNKWDTGDFLKRISPEKTYHYKKELIVRANWVLEERINLKN